jgi:hypothetical protein
MKVFIRLLTIAAVAFASYALLAFTVELHAIVDEAKQLSAQASAMQQGLPKTAHDAASAGTQGAVEGAAKGAENVALNELNPQTQIDRASTVTQAVVRAANPVTVVQDVGKALGIK